MEIDTKPKLKDSQNSDPIENLLKQEISDEEDVPDFIEFVDTTSFRADQKSGNEVLCNKCLRSFSSSEDLEVHDIMHTNEKYCPLCKKMFLRRSDLLNHIKVHFSDRLHKCNYCLRSFVTRKELTLHLRVHTNERPYKCGECGKGFKRKGALSDHKLVHTGEKSHLCPVEDCGIYFTTRSSVRRHVRKVHKLNAREICQDFKHVQEPSKCKICNKQFARKTDLFTHAKEEHNNEDFKCVECDKTFNSYFTLTVHNADKHEPKSCFYCNKSFSGSKEFEAHLYEHFSCNYCKKPFSSDIYLKNHLRIYHNKDSQYNCLVCYTHCQDYNALKIHMKQHDANVTFDCALCKKYFKTKENLRKHNRLYHPTTPFVCSICNKHLASQTSLDIHIRRHEINPNCPKFSCSLCHKAFMYNHLLSSHLKIEHPDVSFQCKFCDKECNSSHALLTHLTQRCSLKNDTICYICDEIFSSATSLKKHYSNEHVHKILQDHSSGKKSKSDIIDVNTVIDQIKVESPLLSGEF